MMMMQDEPKFSLEDIQRQLTGAKDLNQNLSEIEIKAQSITGLAGEIKNAFLQAFSPTSIVGLSQQFDKLSAQRAQLLGITKTEGENIKEAIASSYSQLSRFGVTMNQIRDAQFDFTKEYKTVALIPQEQLNSLMMTAKVSGVETSKLIQNFREAGKNISHMSDDMKSVIDYSRSIGVSVQAVSELVVQNIGKLNTFNFEGGVQGLAKMSASASMLGIDMSKTFAVAEELLSPEKAIELSSSLQRLGVTSSDLLDPLRAMDMAQNDPEELMRQMKDLSSQFVRTKEDGSFEIMPGAKRELREVAKLFNMSTEEFASMGLKAAEMDKKMSEIQFPEFEVGEDTQMLIANMATLNKDKKYEVELIKKDETTGEITKEKKLVSELKKEDLDYLKPEPVKSLEDLALKQVDELTAIKIAVQSMANAPTTAMAASGFFTNIQKGISTQISNAIKPEEITKLFEAAFEEMSKTARSAEGGRIATGKAEVEEMKKYMVESTKNIVTTYGKQLASMLEKAGKVVLPDDFFEQMTTQLNSLITQIPGFEGGISQTLTGVVEGGATAAQNFDITTSFKTLVEKLTKLTEKLDRIFPNSLSEANDFILTKDQMYQYNENDLIIGGTGLLGDMQKNLTPDDTKKVVTGESKFSEPKETIISPQITIRNEENKNLTELISNFVKQPETEVEDEALTSVMIRFNELAKLLHEDTKTEFETPTLQIPKTDEVVNIKPNIDLSGIEGPDKVEKILPFDLKEFEKQKLEYIKQIEELNNLISKPIETKEIKVDNSSLETLKSDMEKIEEKEISIIFPNQRLEELELIKNSLQDIEKPKKINIEPIENDVVKSMVNEPMVVGEVKGLDDNKEKLIEFRDKLKEIIEQPLTFSSIINTEKYAEFLSQIEERVSKISGKSIDIEEPKNLEDLMKNLEDLEEMDPLVLLDKAQNDPNELIKNLQELSSQFIRTKEDGSFEVMPSAKNQLKEISSILGVTEEEFVNIGVRAKQANEQISILGNEKEKFSNEDFVIKEPKLTNPSEMQYKMLMDEIRRELEKISNENIEVGEIVPNENTEKTVSQIKENIKSEFKDPIMFNTESKVLLDNIVDKKPEPESLDVEKSSLSDVIRRMSDRQELGEIDLLNVNNLKINESITSRMFNMDEVKPVELKATVEPFKIEQRNENFETQDRRTSDVNHNFGKMDINVVVQIPGLKDDMTTQNIAKSAVYEMFASGQFQRTFGDQLVIASKKASTSQGINSVDVVV